jgi:hypothetical protein
MPKCMCTPVCVCVCFVFLGESLKTWNSSNFHSFCDSRNTITHWWNKSQQWQGFWGMESECLCSNATETLEERNLISPSLSFLTCKIGIRIIPCTNNAKPIELMWRLMRGTVCFTTYLTRINCLVKFDLQRRYDMDLENSNMSVIYFPIYVLNF